MEIESRHADIFLYVEIDKIRSLVEQQGGAVPEWLRQRCHRQFGTPEERLVLVRQVWLSRLVKLPGQRKDVQGEGIRQKGAGAVDQVGPILIANRELPGEFFVAPDIDIRFSSEGWGENLFMLELDQVPVLVELAVMQILGVQRSPAVFEHIPVFHRRTHPTLTPVDHPQGGVLRVADDPEELLSDNDTLPGIVTETRGQKSRLPVGQGMSKDRKVQGWNSLDPEGPMGPPRELFRMDGHLGRPKLPVIGRSLTDRARAVPRPYQSIGPFVLSVDFFGGKGRRGQEEAVCLPDDPLPCAIVIAERASLDLIAPIEDEDRTPGNKSLPVLIHVHLVGV